MSGLGQLLTGIGGIIAGVAAVAALIVATRAKRDAAEARRISPTAVLEGLRTKVHEVVDAHEESTRRHIDERDGLERALRRERNRADGCELIALGLRASIAEMKIDLAAARSELSELRSRFEATITTKS